MSIKSRENLSEELRDETDFDYVNDLAEPEQRLVAYYEYARHCDSIREMIVEFRREGGFDQQDYSSKLISWILPRINSGAFRGDMFYFLAECKGFPDKPYRSTFKNPECLAAATYSLGIDVPGCFPWQAVDGFRSDFRQKGLSESEVFEKFSLHAIHLPWKYRDDEILNLLRPVLKRLRPKHLPEPPKSGRRGRSGKLGAVDMLRQLAAYRLDKEGHFSVGRDWLYQSEKGRKKAVLTAAERIKGMLSQPFFG